MSQDSVSQNEGSQPGEKSQSEEVADIQAVEDQAVSMAYVIFISAVAAIGGIFIWLLIPA